MPAPGTSEEVTTLQDEDEGNATDNEGVECVDCIDCEFDEEVMAKLNAAFGGLTMSK